MYTFLALICNLLLCIIPIQALLTATDGASIVEISNTVNLFGILVDSGHVGQLSRVFTANTSVNFGLPGIGTLHGLPAVAKEIGSIANVTSQHSITTVHTDLTSASTADTTTYIVGSFFGTDPQAGQIFTVYGTYHIGMLVTRDGWRINTMVLNQTGSIGNISLAFPNGVP